MKIEVRIQDSLEEKLGLKYDEVINQALNELTSQQLANVLKRLVSPREYGGDKERVFKALNTLNSILYVEGFEIYLEGIEPKFRKIQIDFNESKLEKDRELKPLQ